MKTRKMMIVLCASAGAIAMSNIANADSTELNLCFNGIYPGEDIQYNFLGSEMDPNAATRTTGNVFGQAGYLEFINQGSGPYYIRGFCADLEAAMAGGDCGYWKAANVDELPQQDPSGMRAHYLGGLYGSHYTSLSTGNEYAAFQMAVWEIMQENWDADGGMTGELSSTLGAVQFTVGTELKGLVDTYLASAALNADWYANLQGWKAQLGEGSENLQDFITVVPGPSIALAGVIGLVGLRRRRRN